MPDVIHIPSLTLRPSLSRKHILAAPDDFLLDWDRSITDNNPPRYWKIAEGELALMTLQEQAAVDQAIIEARQDAAVSNALDDLESVLRQVFILIVDEFNLHGARFNALLDAIDNAGSLGEIKSSVASINNIPERTASQLRDAVRNAMGS